MKRPEILSERLLRIESQRRYANQHSQRAFREGCEHVLQVLGYSKPKKETEE
jgi:hypothetical protein